MSPKQLEYFLEIYNQRSIKKVAEKMIVSSQAVSKTIKEMEEELQVKLFVRGKKSLEPTVEAEYLKNHAIKILEEYEKIRVIKEFNQMKDKTLTIYSVDGFLQYVTVKFIEDFQKEYSDIVLNIIETTELDIIQRLEKREINTAIVTKPLEHGVFDNTYLYSNRNCLVIHKENPLAKKQRITSDDLDQQPIAGKGSSYSCYTSNIRRLFQRNINPKIMLETTNDALIIKMAERNLAIGITMEHIAHDMKTDDVVIRFIEETGQLRSIFWVENNMAVLTREECIFRDFLLKWIN